jgi:ribosomal protein S18 acetylase RimI-like enzyme
MASIEIRQATRDDLPSILALYAELETDRTTPDLAQAESLFERMQRYPNYHVYVAAAEGEIVGTFALLIMDNLAHMGIPSGIVEDVVVHSSRQGQGIGKQMMLAAMEQCRNAGCYKLVLSSNLERERAHQFYETLGFKKHGYSFVVFLST